VIPSTRSHQNSLSSESSLLISLSLTLSVSVLSLFLGLPSMASFATAMKHLMQQHLNSELIVAAVASRLWIEEGRHSALVCVRSLELVSVCLAQGLRHHGDSFAQVLLPSLLVALDSPTRAVRLQAIRCLSILNDELAAILPKHKGSLVSATRFYGYQDSNDSPPISLLVQHQTLSSRLFAAVLKNVTEHVHDIALAAPQLRRVVADTAVSGLSTEEAQSFHLYLVDHACT